MPMSFWVCGSEKMEISNGPLSILIGYCDCDKEWARKSEEELISKRDHTDKSEKLLALFSVRLP